jgi:hypothetical protein
MADVTPELRPLHILIPTELHARLKAMAEDNDRSVAAETRRAIEARLAEHKAADRETSDVVSAAGEARG